MWPMPKLPSWALPAGIAAFVIVVALAVAFCSGGNREKLKQANRTIETQKQVGGANDKAGELRVEDKARIIRQNEELKDALDKATGGDDARRRAGCVILRQQGLERLPAACAGS